MNEIDQIHPISSNIPVEIYLKKSVFLKIILKTNHHNVH